MATNRPTAARLGVRPPARSGRKGAPRASAPETRASAADRLELLEFLIASTDLEASASRVVEWLERVAGIEQSWFAAVDGNPPRLQGVADRGLSVPRVGEFIIDLSEDDHPFATVLRSSEPVFFPRGPRQPSSPLEGTGFFAIPIHAGTEGENELRGGLLVISADGPRLANDASWIAEVFGRQFSRLRSRQEIAETSSVRERRLLYSIITAVTDPILLTDAEGKMIIANSRAEKLFTAPEEASEGRRRAVALNNMLFSSALSSSAVDHPDENRRELLLVDPSEGTDLLFELLSTPVRDAREGTGIVSILRNITDLGRAAEEIRASQEKLREAEAAVHAERHRLDLIIDSVADPIVVTDPSGEVLLMNSPAERLFSVPTGAGADAQRLVLANDAHFSSFASNLLFSGSDLRYRGEIALNEPLTGRTIPMEAIAGKVLSEMGELTAVVTIFHDRTEAMEKARLYEQLKEASQHLERRVQEATAELADQNELLRRQAIELEQASKLKSQFLANMSHELRTPLNAILGYTNMLLGGYQGELPPAMKKPLSRVDSNGRHLLAIINEILDITRIEAGRMPLAVTKFDLPGVIDEVLAELDAIVVRSRLKVTKELSGTFPALESDRQKVKQILVNLVNNALKFTHQGSVTLRARFDAKSQSFQVAVIDTGIGIDPSYHQTIFEDFQQVDNSPTRPYGGTGLGLSICRRFATMLGGDVSVKSSLGKGSTFTLALPRRVKKTAETDTRRISTKREET